MELIPIEGEAFRGFTELLCGAEEGWRSRGDAFVRPRWARIWTAAHEASGNRMASVGGDVAEDDRDDFGVGALELRATNRDLSEASRIALG
jgi:hypothetical protein